MLMKSGRAYLSERKVPWNIIHCTNRKRHYWFGWSTGHFIVLCIRHEIDYSVNVARSYELRVKRRTCRAVLTFKVTSMIYKLKSFIGLCNVYIRCWQSFANVDAPLKEGLKRLRALLLCLPTN